MNSPIDQVISRLRAMKPHHNQFSLNRDEVELLLSYMDLNIGVTVTLDNAAPPMPTEDPEAYRRERATLDAVPVKDPNIVDYGQSSTRIDRAIHHLDEGLPLGQRKRCALAFAILQCGVHDLGTWMAEKGYFREPAKTA